MKLPNAERALIPIEKVRDYLLSAANPRTRGKAAFFQALGFVPAEWEVFRAVLLEVAQEGNASPGQSSEFGTKYEIRATITGPLGAGLSFAPCGLSTPAKITLASLLHILTDDP